MSSIDEMDASGSSSAGSLAIFHPKAASSVAWWAATCTSRAGASTTAPTSNAH
jgi:hypothetical protein